MSQTDVIIRNLIAGGSIPAAGTTPTNPLERFTVSAAVAGVSTITLAAPGVPLVRCISKE